MRASLPDPRVTVSSVVADVAGRVGGRDRRIGSSPLAIGRLSANVPSLAAVPTIDSPVVLFRAFSVDRPCVRPSSVTALRLIDRPVLRATSSLMAGLFSVEDPAHERRRLGLAAGPDERDAEVVDALGQLRPG